MDAREILAVDYFMGSLCDPDLVLKIREREPTTLDEVLKIALRPEARPICNVTGPYEK